MNEVANSTEIVTSFFVSGFFCFEVLLFPAPFGGATRMTHSRGAVAEPVDSRASLRILPV